METVIITQKTTLLASGTYRYPDSSVDYHHIRFNSKSKHNPFSVPEKNLGLRFKNDATRKMNMAVHANITPGNVPADPSPGQWKIWVIGTIFTILVSFSRGKWGPLLQLKEKVETTIDEAQRVVDIIEDVAEGVDKVAEETVKHLPQGKLRDAAEFVEKLAEDIDEHAQHAEDALEKVENMEKEFESFIDSTTHQEHTITTTAEAKEQK